ncbi:DUF4974 domain-containing protein [Hymenobacter busanensis]|uniref:DUF4974 domain-containing protein n=1 Tax=Hymenobacter busanensis TaxID=2607656 RepID=A0A7L4ZZ06_9BACT|nr:DUF4974 domain-containing protein [Hymenobacter busanensis]KAA9331592.1 DUF4974 domain-containing protein [Hymenobacter busanensis]QHJ08744.1 DUF4974 domain-containing protein [Hymenobacter busanensis]
MRNRICLAAAVLCALAGPPATAQVRTGSVMERKVSVTFNQAPLESVLRTLHKQYGVRISYSNTALNLRQPITLDAQNKPLRAVLDELLRDKNIGYELVGDQVVLHPAPPKPKSTTARPADPVSTASTTTTTVSRASTAAPAEAPAPAADKPASPAASAVEAAKTASGGTTQAAAQRAAAKPALDKAAQVKPTNTKTTAPAGKVPVKPAKPGAAAPNSSASSVPGKVVAQTKAASKPTKPAQAASAAKPDASPAAPGATGLPAADPSATASTATGTTNTAAGPANTTSTQPTAAEPASAKAAQDSAGRAAAVAPVEAPEPEPARPTFTKTAQVSFLGPLGSNGLRSGQTVNKVSLNVLGGYAAGVDGVEAGGLFNVDRDSVRGVQLAGLANVVGKNLQGFQAAGLLNVLGGGGTGWQAAGLLNVAARPIGGAQTAGLFNYVGPTKKTAAPDATDRSTWRPTIQAAGLFNVALAEVRGGQAAGLFNVAGTVHGVQLAGLLNVADTVDGVSIAPLNFVLHGYHRFEVTHSESWPVSASLKLGGSAAFYTFFSGAYDGFGSGPRRWALGYGAGSELLARHRLSVSLDAVAQHVNEEGSGWTDQLNLHNQLRLLVGFAPLKAGGRLRIVAGPVASVFVTQRTATDGSVGTTLSQGRSLWLNELNGPTRVLGWWGYSVGLRL